MDNDLVCGFEGVEKIKVKNFLEKLFPYLKENRFVIVGGLAIRFHLASHDILFPKREFNDLDIIVKNKEVVNPLVTRDFLVYHYHLHPDHPDHEDNFYIVLVDPDTKIKIDIFDSSPNPPNKTIKAQFGKYIVNVVSIEDQLVKTVLDCFRVTNNQINNPKQFKDAKMLMEITDIDTAENYWRKKNLKSHPSSLIKAFQEAENYVKKHPELLVVHPYRKKEPYECKYCINTAEFPLTPISKIYKILGGYVE